MARFGYQDAENYGAQKSNYFSLKDDGETAKVRFLYNTIDDIQGVSVHEVQVGNNTMDVECLRLYNEPVENCPLCAAGYKVNAKLFIPVYDVKSKESKIWSRGRTFFKRMSSLCTRFNPLVSTVFEIERQGKKGDTSTEYTIYPGETDNKRIEDFPEVDAEGTAFQVKTFEEMENYVNTGMFDSQSVQRQPQARNVQSQPQRQATREMPVRRRPTYDGEETF